VADSAYQDMMHHEQPQNIVLSGETMSGKTTQFKLLIKQLAFLGQVGESRLVCVYFGFYGFVVENVFFSGDD
jgi:myosin heavy subunit